MWPEEGRTAAYDLVVVGHIALDFITRQGEIVRSSLGGPPTYASLAASKLGASTAIISKVGEDFPKEYVELLANNGVDLAGLKVAPGGQTTSFLIEYLDGERDMVLKARAPPIEPDDVPPALSSKAILAAPIAGEISRQVVAKLRRRTEFLCLDPQGFVRQFAEDGRVSLRPWFDRFLLSLTDVVKASWREYEHIVGSGDLRYSLRKLHNLGVGVVIITLGEEGSVLSLRGELYAIPSYQVERVAEPTGAGDAYMGAFLAEYVRGEDPVWCACVGTAAASFVVEDFGPSRFGSREEVLERAEVVQDMVVKL